MILKKIEAQEDEYPNQVDEVPVEADFFDHFIAIASFDVHATDDVDEDDEQYYYAAEYVESVESRDGEKQLAEGLGAELLEFDFAFVVTIFESDPFAVVFMAPGLMWWPSPSR